MFLLSEIWQRRRQFSLSILSNYLALFLLLAVSTLSRALMQTLEGRLEQMSLQVSCLQYLDQKVDERTLSAGLAERYHISRYSEFRICHRDEYDLVYCRDLSVLFPLDFQLGGFFTDHQVANNENAAVLGHEIWQDLGCPLPGEEINIDGAWFSVSGVLTNDTENIYFSADELIFLPLDYCRDYQESRLFFISDVPYLSDWLDEVLGEDNYLLIRQKMLKTSFSRLLRQGQAILMTLSLFALIISLLGMVNHMLSSLPTRCREIGIKKAIGARDSDIFFQFILEAQLVMLISSLGAAASNEVLMKTVSLLGLFEPGTDRSVYRIFLMVIPAGCALCFYPAVKAAKISISQAIRH